MSSNHAILEHPVDPANARAVLAVPEVGGALVGGASLKPTDFEAIVRAVPPHV